MDPNSSSGNERFYVMALEDAASGTYQFGISSETSPVPLTSADFGTGETNTAAMKANSVSSSYLWGLSAVQSGIWNSSDGWYVPSKEEWSAFAGQLNITTSDYSSKGLSDSYWTSSHWGATEYAWRARFNYNNLAIQNVGYSNSVRLGTTF